MQIQKKSSHLDHKFAIGDAVIVCKGEQHLRGKITAIDGNKITVLPKHEDLKEPLEFQAHELKKFFSPGDQVCVIEGHYKNHTGCISTVETNAVVLFSDQARHDIQVQPENLHMAGEIESTSKSELVLGSVRIDEVILYLH